MTQPIMFNVKDPGLQVPLPNGLICLAYRGSIAHGMYVPPEDPKSIDDTDLIGVVVAPKEHYLGLTEWGSRGTQEIKHGRYDIVIYELRKMVSLLLQGNPNVLSLLWTKGEHFSIKLPAFKAFLDARSLFVGKHVYNAFAGYANAQLLKMETRDPAELRMYLALTAEAKFRGIHPNHKGQEFPYPEGYEPNQGEGDNAARMHDDVLLTRLRSYQKKGENLGYLGEKRKQLVLEHGYDSKNAAHLIRLLRMCVEFMKTGELTVYRPDAQELLDIKKGKWPLNEVKRLSNELFLEAKAAKDASNLPDGPDKSTVEKLLVSVLSNELQTGGV